MSLFFESAIESLVRGNNSRRKKTFFFAFRVQKLMDKEGKNEGRKRARAKVE
jgi:hypothetical protein